jgi:hypothetical protein
MYQANLHVVRVECTALVDTLRVRVSKEADDFLASNADRADFLLPFRPLGRPTREDAVEVERRWRVYVLVLVEEIVSSSLLGSS